MITPFPFKKNAKKNGNDNNSFDEKAFLNELIEVVNSVDAQLDELLPRTGELEQRLYDAMRYSAFGGKRIRSFMLVNSARIFNVPPKRALWVASALECLQAYALIHDDLPAMDDASTR